MIEDIVSAVSVAVDDEHIGARNIAASLWLAAHMGHERRDDSSDGPVQPRSSSLAEVTDGESVSRAPTRPTKSRRDNGDGEPAAEVTLPLPPAPETRPPTDRLDLRRAFSPLGKHRATGTRPGPIDPEATVRAFVETRVLHPIFHPSRERWFDAALIVDRGPSMAVWDEAATTLGTFLANSGAFRDVRRWTLTERGSGYSLRLRGETGSIAPLEHLSDRVGRRLIMVFTDCVGDLWYRKEIWQALESWSREMPVVLIDVLPVHMWSATGLGPPEVRVRASRKGLPNSRLTFDEPWWWPSYAPSANGHSTGRPVRSRPVPLPVIPYDDRSLTDYTKMLMGSGQVAVDGIVIDPRVDAEDVGEHPAEGRAVALTPDERVRRFRAGVSPGAYGLAVYLSAFKELRIPVMRAVQRAMLPDSTATDLAEFFTGGLLERSGTASESPFDVSTDETEFDFVAGVRQALQRDLKVTEMLRALSVISADLEDRHGRSPLFASTLQAYLDTDRPIPRVSEFAAEYAELVRAVGSKLAEMAPPSSDEGALTRASGNADPHRTGGIAPRAGTTELRVLTRHGAAWSEALRGPIAQAYEAHTDGRVTIVTEPAFYSEVHDRIEAELSGGSGFFDLVATDNFWCQGLIDNGWVAGLEDLRASSPELPGIPFGNLAEGSFVYSSRRGRHWGLPVIMTTPIFVYRKDRLSSAGIADVPRTWEAFLDAAEAMHSPVDGHFGCSLLLGEMDSCITEWIVRMAGMRIARPTEDNVLSQDNEPVFNEDRRGERAIELIREVLPYASPHSDELKYEDVKSQLAYKGSAMLITWTDIIDPTIEEHGRAENRAKGNLGYTTYPAETVPQQIVGGWTIFLNASSSNLTEAYRFLAWMAAGDAYRLMRRQGELSLILKSDLEDPEVPRATPLLEWIPDFRAAGRVALPPYRVPNADEVQRILYQEIEAGISGEKTARRCMEDAESRVRRAVLGAKGSG